MIKFIKQINILFTINIKKFMGMHVGEIIFSKFQGKYEKKKKIIYIYNFKTVVKKKFIKDNL